MKNVTGIFSLIILLLLLTSSLVSSTEKPTQTSDKTEISLCDCYSTNQISSTDFINKEDIITNVETKCRKGFFITGMTQSAEKDPISFGQYVIVSDIECCRPCLTEKKK